MVIVFHSNQIAERGTETAIIDYALANEQILNNISIISFPSYKILNKERYDYIKSRFQTIEYQEKKDLHDFLVANKADLLYIIEDGEAYPDTVDLLPEKRPYKTFVHAVFSTKRKHGDFYCPISNYLNKAYHTHYPVLPHIVKPFNNTTADLRREFSIPTTATVFGGYGGKDSFDIPFVHAAVIAVAKTNPNCYFLFMNFRDFTITEQTKLRNIIFLPGNTDNLYKEKFINTCDAMLHARTDGETFGLAVAEFATKNKPIITYKKPLWYVPIKLLKWIMHKREFYQTAHLMNLGKNAITYSNSKELVKILTKFNKNHISKQKISKNFLQFSEVNVMRIFNKIISNS